MGALNTIDGIFTVFALGSLPIYLMLMGVIARKRKYFPGPFFTIMLWTAVPDTVHLLGNLILMDVMRIFFYEETVDNMILPTIMRLGINWTVYFQQVSCVLLIVLNRFTAVVYPLRHKRMWRKRNLYAAIGTAFAWPLVFVLPVFHPCCRSNYDKNTFYPIYVDNKWLYEVYMTMDMVLEPGILMPSILALHAATVYKAMRTSKAAAGGATTAAERRHMSAELKLTVIALVQGGIYIVLCANYTVALALSHEATVVAATPLVYFVMSKLLIVANPYLLLAFSTPARRHFLLAATCGKVDVGTGTTTVAPMHMGPTAGASNMATGRVITVQPQEGTAVRY